MVIEAIEMYNVADYNVSLDVMIEFLPFPLELHACLNAQN